MAAKRKPAPRIKAAAKRTRKKRVPVKGYCRRKARSAMAKAERARKSMPF